MSGRPLPLADPVRLELFTNRLSAIARDMGEVLRRSALSTNVKERLDFSCALLDPGGSLVVNAPHIPVHLGALGLCVRRVAAAIEMAPGDVVVTNHPGYGGSHLPDVTVITPIFAAGAAPRLLGYAASRAHHAEIGGSRPGSMPPDATRLIDEGVVLPPMHLVRRGRPCWDEVRRRLAAPPWPSRAPDENLADLAAAVAANRRGAAALARLAAAEGADVVASAMAGLEARAETLLRRALARLAGERPGRMEAEDRLDDGAPLRVAIELLPGAVGGGADAPAVRIDLTGSAGVHPGNLNATPAIVRSVVLYVLRLLVGEPLPLNEGLARPVELIVPEGMLAPPFPDDPALCPAVVGGNVETSQRLVDLLLAALGLAAGSQGTMNNVLWGGAGFGYYETVAGGCGAGPGFAGASAVHSHMTNTRATDPEILERRYPVRLERFAVRRGSGGAGRWPGGDGVVRETVFLAPLTLSLLTQHRTTAPHGAAGGHDGAPGRQVLVRATGEVEDLPPIAGREVAPGDRLILETPGGGGWGAPAKGAEKEVVGEPEQPDEKSDRGSGTGGGERALERRRSTALGLLEERRPQPCLGRSLPVEGAPRGKARHLRLLTTARPGALEAPAQRLVSSATVPAVRSLSHPASGGGTTPERGLAAGARRGARGVPDPAVPERPPTAEGAPRAGAPASDPPPKGRRAPASARRQPPRAFPPPSPTPTPPP